jgi:predicted porin
MNRILIALAIGAAFAAPTAYADVTLSGSINAGPAFIHEGDGSTNQTNSIRSTGATAPGGTHTGINDNYSNVTIGSLEDLGGGLKLDFAFQIIAPISHNSPNTLGPNIGNNVLVNRNSHIGLVSDSWGGVWYGTNEQLYESYLYTADPLDGAAGLGGNLQLMGTPGYGQVFDAFNNNNPRAAGAAGSAEFYRRTDQSIWYNSPNFNGFTAGVYTSLTPSKGSGPGAINPQIWGLGGKYVGTSLPIQVWAAYEHHKDLFGLDAIRPAQAFVATSSSDHGIQLGGGYTFGDLFVYAIFEQLKYNDTGLAGTAVSSYRRNAEDIGVKWNLATGYVGAQVMLAQKGKCDLANGGGCDASNSGGKVFAAGYYHTLSKQTQAYVMVDYNKNDSLQYYGVAGGTGGFGNLGANIWGATVGLKHSF